MERLVSSDFDALRQLDTPTVCNALEVVAPQRRGFGYTSKMFFCPRPTLEPMVGFARTATIASMQAPDSAPDEQAKSRMAYYEYIDEGGPQPSIAVIEDLDPVAGYGAWWGEVNTNIHFGLGCLGVITNGSVRDLDDSAEGFQLLAGSTNPSHAWVRIVDHGVTVTVHGMTVNPGELIHADRHGAVVVPIDLVREIPIAAAQIAQQERVLIQASQQPGFSSERLRTLMGLEPGH